MFQPNKADGNRCFLDKYEEIEVTTVCVFFLIIQKVRISKGIWLTTMSGLLLYFTVDSMKISKLLPDNIDWVLLN